MRTFHIFQGDAGNGDFETRAIEDQALEETMPDEFFDTSVINIHKVGVITIEGDAEDKVDECFSIKSPK